jgi:peptide/nickel transport system permease protein
MGAYILRRLLYAIPTLIIISMISFIVIELPPGDYLSTYITQLQEQGSDVSRERIESLTKIYGLDKPVYVRYFKWIGNILFRGDFGGSFLWNRPVTELIGERILLTVVISLCTMLFVYLVSVPIGIYAATHQYSLGDYAFTVVGFIGLATPNFLLALILMFIAWRYFGLSVGGLFSKEFEDAAWNIAKFIDLLRHLWIPIIVIGTAGTAGLIRVMRGCLLDEFRKQYVVTARAKGKSERALLFKYPVRIAINPIVSTIGWMLPYLISGGTITAIVLNLPTTGPLLLQALMSQDMYLAGSFILILSVLTVIGTLISDLLLVLVDPRIRYE